MIDTREELIHALTEAAELEHGILIQYLFAAYSMKKRMDEGLTAHQQELVREWEGIILGVAREEMAHLGSVCNMLSAIGAAPRFGRPNFPQPATEYHPFDFHLERFNLKTLEKFIRFEQPKPDNSASIIADSGVAPDPLQYEYLGELYKEIKEGFFSIPEKDLFIGPKFAQDTDDWSLRMKLHLVKDRETAAQAIDFIVLEGEGSPTATTNSHHSKFVEIRKELLSESGKNFDPARPVVNNPLTRHHRDIPISGTLIKNEITLKVAELFNSVYSSLLLMFMQFYAYGGETSVQRKGVQSALRHIMSGVIRPLAEILTEMPVESGLTDKEKPFQATAGPGFEIYSELRLSPYIENRWTILFEQLEMQSKAAKELANINPRLEFIGTNIEWEIINLKNAAQGGMLE